MMDPALKNRLVGMVILLLLAVIVLPIVFDGANEKALLADTRMPIAPQVPAAESLLAPPPALLPEVQAEIAAAHAEAEPETGGIPVAVAPGIPSAQVSGAAAVASPVVSKPAAGTVAPVSSPPATSPSPAASASKVVATAPHVPAASTAPVVVAPVETADTRLAGLAEAWDVQLVAVSTPESAEQMRTKLVKAGFKARIRQSGTLYRVLVGPQLRKEDALALRDQFASDARFGKLNGMLVRYVP